jgi:hypothetical protein
VVGFEIDSCVGGGRLSIYIFLDAGVFMFRSRKFMVSFSSCVGLSFMLLCIWFEDYDIIKCL